MTISNYTFFFWYLKRNCECRFCFGSRASVYAGLHPIMLRCWLRFFLFEFILQTLTTGAMWMWRSWGIAASWAGMLNSSLPLLSLLCIREIGINGSYNRIPSLPQPPLFLGPSSWCLNCSFCCIFNHMLQISNSWTLFWKKKMWTWSVDFSWIGFDQWNSISVRWG